MSWVEIKAQREKRNKLIADAGALLKKASSESRSMNAEENTQWQRMHDEAETVRQHVETLEMQAQAERSAVDMIGRNFEEPENRSNEVRKQAFYKRLLRQDLNDVETRALAGASNSFVPDSFYESFVAMQKYDGGPRQAGATVVVTEDMRTITVPRIDDTANEGSLKGENVDSATDVEPTQDSVNLGAFRYDSGEVLLSKVLTESSAFDVEQWLVPQLVRRVNWTFNKDATTADGTGEAQGCVYGATIGKTAASTTAITYNEILELIYSVNPAYLQNPEDCYLMFNYPTALAVRKLNDGQGNSLWQPSAVAGQPDRLAGFKYVINPHMASIGAGNKSILFGNFKLGVMIRQVRDIELESDYYMRKAQHGFVARLYADSRIVDGNALRALANPSS